VTQGDRAALGDSTKIEVLWPPADCDFKPNDAALVLKVTCAGRSILFPADIQERAERELLKHPDILKSDVLIAPHHGSAEATTAQFIRAVNPKVILSSNDARLTMKQRLFDEEVSDRPLYRTSRYGAITVEIDKDGGLRITPYRGGQGKTIEIDRTP
jgi:competence protein ComEC